MAYNQWLSKKWRRSLKLTYKVILSPKVQKQLRKLDKNVSRLIVSIFINMLMVYPILEKKGKDWLPIGQANGAIELEITESFAR